VYLCLKFKGIQISFENGFEIRKNKKKKEEGTPQLSASPALGLGAAARSLPLFSL